jgi:hypothetical protein
MQLSERRSNQEVLNRTACSNCLHDAEEHDNYKCYALDYDGTTYFACKCTKLKFEFKITLNVPDKDKEN